MVRGFVGTNGYCAGPPDTPYNDPGITATGHGSVLPSRSAAAMERRLAAIFAADVAGYSRLIGADEEGTLARLQAHRRELIDPKIPSTRGAS